MREIENGGKEWKRALCRLYGLVHYTMRIICENRTKIIDAFEKDGSRIN